MKRREFLSGCACGLTLAAGSLAAPEASRAAEKAPRRKIDPDELAKRAYEHFIPGKRTCCESVLMAGCEALGIKSDLVPDIALGLGGGVGLQGETCAVLTSAALVLSLAVAAKETEYPKKKMLALQATGRLHREFRKRFGRTDCRSLSGLDLTTPEGRKKLMGGVKADKCAKLVRASAELLAKELKAI